MGGERATLGAVLLALAATAACAGLPPSRTDLSTVAHGGGAGYRVAAGAHSGSLPRRADVPFDLGAGYIYEDAAAEPQHGSYIELGRPIWRSGNTRVLAAGRVEMFWNSIGATGTTRAGSVRLALERRLGHLAGGVSDSNGGGAAFGILAPGLFLEAGARQLEPGEVTGTVVAGISLRLPLLVAAGRPTIW
jgi:hypothetical protein